MDVVEYPINFWCPKDHAHYLMKIFFLLFIHLTFYFAHLFHGIQFVTSFPLNIKGMTQDIPSTVLHRFCNDLWIQILHERWRWHKIIFYLLQEPQMLLNNFPTLGLTTAWYLPKSSRINIFLKCLELFFHALRPDCFEFRACLAIRCLCSQNIKKYSNKPTKGYKRMVEDFRKFWLL